MSELIRRLNLIKKNCSVSWLTPSQGVALSQFVNATRLPTTVNLVGGVGVGKTFLCWVIAQQFNYCYLSSPRHLLEKVERQCNGVVIDNCPFSREGHRELLKTLRFCDIERGIFVTRQLIQDYTQYIELNFTTADVKQVAENLTSIGIPVDRYDCDNLWTLVNPSL